MSEEENEFISNDTESRQEVINVVRLYGSERIYLDTISLTEFVQVVFTRADQISNGAKIYIEKETAFAQDIAIKEIVQGRCPLAIVRSRGTIDGVEYVEIWNVNELRIPKKCIIDAQSIISGKKMNIMGKIDDLIV